MADSYDRGRPSYPADAVKWLVGDEPVSVLELGAGTGKLTEVLVQLGHDVFATDPDDAMLDILSEKLPDVRATSGTAEQIPTGDSLYDVVVVGQAFHWFDHAKALAEIGRVLKTDGRLAVIQNERDERIPWVRKLGRLIGTQDTGFDPTEILDDSGMFSAVEAQTFRHWQVVDRHSIQDLVVSRSNIAVLEPEAQDHKRREVLAFYDDYGRGMDGMQLPYNCRAWRAQVLPHAVVASTGPTTGGHEVVEAGEEPRVPLAKRTDTAVRLPRVVTDPENGDDDLLIDFR
ncbi:SAM-dependent methyltransferase [Nocardioides luteus]|uniref:SAM-dependent methyltransferase n=1 Tax=Nocardioides luteus TaxID=1844 RepID=A0A1J4N7A1_9ACTN|nr:SAM-dependent methyltransferase [Nocardioides luteus]